MTERAARHVRRTRERFDIGPSHWLWRGDVLEIGLREWSVPIPRAVRGTLRVRPEALTSFHAPLDAAGRHVWSPIAPCARIEVAMESPELRWTGDAYIDSNEGSEPIGRAFRRWDWLRTASADGSTAVVYDVQPHAEPPRLITRNFAPDGTDTPFEAPAHQALPRAPVWRIDRQVHAEGQAHVVRTLEDTPFYARSLLRMQVAGQPVSAVHETFDATRLERRVVQSMLPWRMPRRV